MKRYRIEYCHRGSLIGNKFAPRSFWTKRGAERWADRNGITLVPCHYISYESWAHSNHWQLRKERG